MLLVLDVDGVMTDGTKYYGPNGEAIMKKFADVDFTAIKKLKLMGWDVCFLSGDPKNAALAKQRKIDFFSAIVEKDSIQIINKLEVFQEILKIYSATVENSMYAGDDLFDLPLINYINKHGGKTYAPLNAIKPVQDAVQIVINKNGGEGVVMEIALDYMTNYDPPHM